MQKFWFVGKLLASLDLFLYFTQIKIELFEPEHFFVWLCKSTSPCHVFREVGIKSTADRPQNRVQSESNGSGPFILFECIKCRVGENRPKIQVHARFNSLSSQFEASKWVSSAEGDDKDAKRVPFRLYCFTIYLHELIFRNFFWISVAVF